MKFPPLEKSGEGAFPIECTLGGVFPRDSPYTIVTVVYTSSQKLPTHTVMTGRWFCYHKTTMLFLAHHAIHLCLKI